MSSMFEIVKAIDEKSIDLKKSFFNIDFDINEAVKWENCNLET